MSRGPFEWDEDIQRLGERIDDFFDRVLGFASSPRYVLQHSWRPAVDVYEVEGGVLVIAELPGVDDRQLSVTIDNGRLRISGTRRPPDVEHCVQPLQLEIDYGPFERLVTLAGDVDPESISARFRYGMLAVHVPLRKRKQTVHVRVSETDEP